VAHWVRFKVAVATSRNVPWPAASPFRLCSLTKHVHAASPLIPQKHCLSTTSALARRHIVYHHGQIQIKDAFRAQQNGRAHLAGLWQWLPLRPPHEPPPGRQLQHARCQRRIPWAPARNFSSRFRCPRGIRRAPYVSAVIRRCRKAGWCALQRGRGRQFCKARSKVFLSCLY
jgi:hypothetical protein